MTKFRNSLTWRDTVSYAVNVFSFLIRGEGGMSGKDFAAVIRDYYSGKPATENADGSFSLHLAYNQQAFACADEVEKHVFTIEATYKGTKYSIV